MPSKTQKCKDSHSDISLTWARLKQTHHYLSFYQIFQVCQALPGTWNENSYKTRLTYNCAHLGLNNKKNKNKLSQNGLQDWTLILDKKWFDQFFAIPDHFWQKMFFNQNFSSPPFTKRGGGSWCQKSDSTNFFAISAHFWNTGILEYPTPTPPHLPKEECHGAKKVIRPTEGAEEVDQGEVSTTVVGMLESSEFWKYSTLLVIQLFSWRLCLCHCLCICPCLCICVPYSFLNSYNHKLSENVWVWGLGEKKWRRRRCCHSGTNERTNKQTRKDRATQPFDHGRLRCAIWAFWVISIH